MGTLAWHLEQALAKFILIRENLTDESKKAKLKGLYDYLGRNQAYLVNYEARKQANQTYK